MQVRLLLRLSAVRICFGDMCALPQAPALPPPGRRRGCCSFSSGGGVVDSCTYGESRRGPVRPLPCAGSCRGVRMLMRLGLLTPARTSWTMQRPCASSPCNSRRSWGCIAEQAALPSLRLRKRMRKHLPAADTGVCISPQCRVLPGCDVWCRRTGGFQRMYSARDGQRGRGALAAAEAAGTSTIGRQSWQAYFTDSKMNE